MSSSPLPEPTRTFHAICHCKSSTLSFTVPTSTLPLPTHFCHCSICRYTHGTLCSIHAPIPEPVLHNPSSLTAYKSSAVVTRYFCEKCGAHMCDRAEEEKGVSWCVAATMVEGAGEEVLAFWGHIFVEGAGDGGLAVWVKDVGVGRKMQAWRERPVEGADGDGDWDWKDAVPKTQCPGVKNVDEKLQVKCHCGGVEFYIARPRDLDAFVHIPPTLVPKDKTKWYAAHDVCTSCRLVCGSAIISWMFPDISYISLADGSPYRPVFGTTKVYESSAGVTRTFCGRCGATVSYACDERPRMIDVAVGLLRAGSGTRAEEWLEWRTEKVVYGEDCVWEGMLDGLRRGLVGWGREKEMKEKSG